MELQERIRQLRGCQEPYYNCAQAVLVAFAPRLGLGEEDAHRLTAHFGGGMRHGSTCGAVSAALMVLGGLGCDESQAAQLLRRFREEHGSVECTQLLQRAKEAELPRKPHCDELVYAAVALLEEIAPG